MIESFSAAQAAIARVWTRLAPWVPGRSDLEQALRRLEAPVGLGVSIFVASFNTVDATQLCIRSMRKFAGYPFELVVGDSGSRDGSLEVLQSLESKGWLRLEVAREGRSHSAWLDYWRCQWQADLAVFVDSDIEFRRMGWLHDLVVAASSFQAALVCAEMLPEARNFVEPVAGRVVRAMARPAPWLLLIDTAKTARIAAGFAFHKEETSTVPEGIVVHDIGGWFYEHIKRAGLRSVVMPAAYRRKFHHYGGLSWIPTTGKRGRKKLRDLRTVNRHLRRYQSVSAGPNV